MGKEKKEKVIKDKISREFSSGGVVFKKIKNNVFWLVSRSMPSTLYPKAIWRLPKGWIDEGESVENAALREVREETGVEAEIVKKIETIKYFYTHPTRGRVFKFVTLFLMKWIKDLPEGFDNETSEIAWLPFSEAYIKLTISNEKKVLSKAKDIFNSLELQQSLL